MRLPFLLSFLLLAACGREQEQELIPWKTKLADVAAGELATTLAEPPAVPLLPARNAADARGWLLATDSRDPFLEEPGVLERSVTGTGLTLRGSRGFAYRIVPVAPSTCYRFRAGVRANGLEVDEPFHGAAPWIAELSRDGTPRELLSRDPEEFVVSRELFPSAHGHEGWLRHERLLVTGAETRALLLGLILSFDAPVRGGSVDFDGVELDRLPLAAHWREDLAEAQEDFARGELPLSGWRATRLVRGDLGAEVRPSIVLLPGERLRLPLSVPNGRPELETGLGLWAPALLSGTGRALAFRASIDGTVVLAWDTEAPDDPAEARWRDETVDLARWAGRDVEFELALDGDLPGLFGAPVVRDASYGAHEGAREKNVLLVSIDTLRADHVGSYGAQGNPTPHLDRLAEQGIRCAHVDGQAPYTLPGHATLLTGQFPSVHGVQRTTQVLSLRRSPLFARILSERGYRTQAFTGGGFVNADFGFDRGFDGFANIDPLRQRDARFFEQILRNEAGALRRLRRNSRIPNRITLELVDEYGPQRIHTWLEEHRDEPFFLFLHTYAVHDYDPPAEYLTCHEDLGCTSNRTNYEEHRLTRKKGWNPSPISDADRAHLVHLYDATLRFVDELIGELMAKLERLELDRNTIVVVTTDHGEEMFERGFMQHGKTLYEELTRLPLILRIPGEAPRVLESPAMQVDLVPTLLGALGIPADTRMQGADLLAGAPARATWSEIDDDFVKKYALRSEDGWKLLFAPQDAEVEFPAPYEWRLFDLRIDPGELHDRSASAPDRLVEMQRDLLRHAELFRTYGDGLGSVETGEIDADTQRELEGLGYGGGEPEDDSR